MDVHSNLIVDFSPNFSDESSIKLVRTGPALGIFRNNVIYPGCTACDTARVFEANDVCTDPDCVPYGPPRIDQGVTTQAPLWDFYGKNRDAAPDIGPIEY